MCSLFWATKLSGVYPRKKLQKCVIINLESRVGIEYVHIESDRVESMSNIKTASLIEWKDATVNLR